MCEICTAPCRGRRCAFCRIPSFFSDTPTNELDTAWAEYNGRIERLLAGDRRGIVVYTIPFEDNMERAEKIAADVE